MSDNTLIVWIVGIVAVASVGKTWIRAHYRKPKPDAQVVEDVFEEPYRA